MIFVFLLAIGKDVGPKLCSELSIFFLLIFYFCSSIGWSLRDPSVYVVLLLIQCVLDDFHPNHDFFCPHSNTMKNINNTTSVGSDWLLHLTTVVKKTSNNYLLQTKRL